MFRPPEYAALINPIACNAFAMRCEGRNDIEQTLVIDTGTTPDETPLSAETLNVTTQSQVCDAKMFVMPFVKLLTPVTTDYAGKFFLGSFTFSIDGELVVNQSAIEKHLLCPACQIAIQPSPATTNIADVRLLLGEREDELLGGCQMFFLPNGTRINASIAGIPTGAPGNIRVNTGAVLANYTTKARQGCLFGVGALDAQAQAYPVTFPCPATFGAAPQPSTVPATSVSAGPTMGPGGTGPNF
jgi:hypothetical protein